MIDFDHTKSRSFYPWDQLTEVGESFMTPNKYTRQLVYAKNKSNKKRNITVRYKAQKLNDGYEIIRIS